MSSLPRVPAATTLHVPRLGGTLQAVQLPVHPVLQQNPSAQNPLAHVSPPPEHGCPAFSLHAPRGSQVFAPAQVLGSSALVIVLHAPAVPAHVLHGPLHGPAQQVPCSQMLDTQLSAVTHEPPFGPKNSSAVRVM